MSCVDPFRDISSIMQPYWTTVEWKSRFEEIYDMHPPVPWIEGGNGLNCSVRD